MKWFPLFIFSALIFLFGFSLFGPRGVSSEFERPMPEFVLPFLDDTDKKSGKTFSDKDIRGKVAVVNFWASWCGPCRYEHPALVEIAKKYDVMLIGVNYKEQAPTALGWLKDLENPYGVSLSDSNGKVGIEWGVSAIPETFLVDENGIIRYKHTGPITLSLWEDELWPLICQWSNNALKHCEKA